MLFYGHAKTMSTKNAWLQFELGQTKELLQSKLDELDAGEQIPLLPRDNLQELFDIENPILSEREQEIMPWVLSGWSIMDMALKIPLSIPGVKFRLGKIYAKFGCENRLQLVKKAFKDGLQYFVEGSPIKQGFTARLDFKEFEQKEQIK